MKIYDEKIVNIEIFDNYDETLFYVYLHLTKDEEVPFYVGKGRMKRCLHTDNRSKWWNHIVNKHDYIIKILEINLIEDDAFKSEIYWINTFGRRNIHENGTLVNLCDGGEGVSGKVFTEEERRIKSEFYKAHPEFWSSGINREKYFGKVLLGENNPNFGNTGKKNPLSIPVVKTDLYGVFIEQYDSLRECAEQNKVDPTSISQICKKQRNSLYDHRYFYLYDYNPETQTLQDLPKHCKQPVYQLDKETNNIIKEYPSCRATKEFGFNSGCVNQVCHGEKKTHLGYKWCFVKNYKQIE